MATEEPDAAARSMCGPPGNGRPSSRATLSKASPAASSMVGAERLDRGGHVAHPQQRGVPAGDQQRQAGVGQRAVLELVDGDVGGEVVHAVQRLAQPQRQRLGRGDADQQRPGQPGPGGDGERVDVVEGDPGGLAGPLDGGHHRLEVGARRDLGYDAAEPRVLLHRGGDRRRPAGCGRGRCPRRSRRTRSRCRGRADRRVQVSPGHCAHPAVAGHDRARAGRGPSRAGGREVRLPELSITTVSGDHVTLGLPHLRRRARRDRAHRRRLTAGVTTGPAADRLAGAPDAVHDAARRQQRADRGRRGHPQHRLGEVDDPPLLRRRQRRRLGIADKTSSPYISELAVDHRAQERYLDAGRKHPRPAASGHRKPAIVFDADDTTLWTYDMEDKAMGFNFDPALQDDWVQDQLFPATPAWSTS